MEKKYFHRSVYRFRRFACKAWAAFMSLHREVNIGTVRLYVADKEMLKAGKTIALSVLMLFSVSALADEMSADDGPDEILQLSLQEVQVISQKAEVNSASYRLITQLSGEEIQALPVQTIADVLAYLPGVDVRQRGANGAQADVSMRGGTFDQVLILLNGVNVTDAHTGHYSMNLPVDVSLIERVEVLQGTAANIFGLNAFAGAINIVTKAPNPQPLSPKRARGASARVTLGMEAGMYGYVAPSIAARVQKGDWYVNASGSYTRQDGFTAPNASEKEQEAMRNSDLKLANIYAQAGFIKTNSSLDMQMGAQYKDAGAGLFYGSSLDQFDATRTAFGSVNYNHRWGAWSMDAQAMYRANHDHYEWHKGQAAGSNTHLSQNAALSVKGHYASMIGRTTVGVELRNENLKSTNLGDTNRLNVNYFAEQTFHYQDLSAGVGVSGNWNNMFGSNMCGGANIGYAFAPTGKVYVNANRSLRLPTFTDLYYKAGQQRGNKDLKAEKAWLLSVGAQYTQPIHWANGTDAALDCQASVYYRWGRDIIDWVYNEEDALYHAQNWNKVDAAGVEATVRYRHNEWLRKVELSYAYTYLSIDMSKTVSNYLDHLKHKAVVSVEHGIYVARDWRIGATWMLTFRDREGQYKSADGVTEAYKPLLLLDGEMYWENKLVHVGASCTNMTNRRYYDYGGILQSGAMAKLSLQVRL